MWIWQKIESCLFLCATLASNVFFFSKEPFQLHFLNEISCIILYASCLLSPPVFLSSTFVVVGSLHSLSHRQFIVSLHHSTSFFTHCCFLTTTTRPWHKGSWRSSRPVMMNLSPASFINDRMTELGNSPRNKHSGVVKQSEDKVVKVSVTQRID